MAAVAGTTIPSALGEQVDELYSVRERRLALQREVDKLEQQEEDLRAVVIKRLEDTQGVTGVAGHVARAELGKDTKPELTSWPKFFSYVRKNNLTDLVERRVGKNAWLALRAAGKKIPGTRAKITATLSVTKL